jgi:uncharacterized membrane protein
MARDRSPSRRPSPLVRTRGGNRARTCGIYGSETEEIMSDLDRDDHRHPRSTARIGGHPIHPMLVPIPIVCFIGAFVADIFYVRGGGDQAIAASASIWLLAIGLVGAALAATAGFTDYFGSARIRDIKDATHHMIANLLAVVLEVVNLFVRLNDREAIAGTGIILSGIVVLILLYSGWKGGELVFRHGVGVLDDGQVR